MGVFRPLMMGLCAKIMSMLKHDITYGGGKKQRSVQKKQGAHAIHTADEEIEQGSKFSLYPSKLTTRQVRQSYVFQFTV